MNRRSVTTCCAIATALFLLVIGILHAVVNVSGLARALERGEIAARLGDAVLVNAAFSGIAMSLLGVFVLIVLPGLRAGSRHAHRIAMTIGLSIGVVGAAAYAWAPTKPAVLIFLVFGAVLVAPLVMWRRDFAKREDGIA